MTCVGTLMSFWKFLAYVCLCGYVHSSAVDEDSLELPAPKKKRLSCEWEKRSFRLGGMCMPAEVLSSQLLQTLESAYEQGRVCTVDDLRADLCRSCDGELSVLEAVVDMMFREKVFVAYKDHTFSLLKNFSVVPQNAYSAESVLAASIVRLLPNKEWVLAELAYGLCMQGYRFENFLVFTKMYKSISALCHPREIDFYVQTRNFLEFMQRSFQFRKEKVLHMAATYHKKNGVLLSQKIRTIAHYILKLPDVFFSEVKKGVWREKQDCSCCEFMEKFHPSESVKTFDVVSESSESLFCDDPVLDDVMPLEKKTSPPRLEEGITPKNSTIFWSVLSDVFSHNRNVFFDNDNRRVWLLPGKRVVPCPEEDLEIFLANLLLRERCHSCISLACKAYAAGYRLCSVRFFRTVYNVVRFFCNLCADSFSQEIKAFFVFEQKKSWGPKDSFRKKVATYFSEQKCIMRQVVEEAVRHILSMHVGLVGRLKSLVDEFCMSSEALPLVLSDSQKILMQKMQEWAQKNQTLDYSDIVPYLSRFNPGHVQALTAILQNAIQKNINVNYSRGTFSFGVLAAPRKKPCVPMEVQVAARFDGQSCSSKERVLFINNLYQEGYPIFYLDQAMDMFDVICLARDIDLKGVRRIYRCRAFLEYVMRFSGEKCFSDLRQSYAHNDVLKDRDVSLVENALVLKNSGIFEDWGVGPSCSKVLSEEERQERHRKIIFRILQKYKDLCHAPCSYKVFATFLPCRDFPKKVFRCVLDAAFQGGFWVDCDKNFETYSLSSKRQKDLTGLPQLQDFILEKIKKNPSIDCEELAYDVHAEGYAVGSYEVLQDFYHVSCVLSAGADCEPQFARCREFLCYALKKIRKKEVSCKLRALIAMFCARNAQCLSQTDEDFAMSVLRLFRAGVLTDHVENMIFTEEVLPQE